MATRQGSDGTTIEYTCGEENPMRRDVPEARLSEANRRQFLRWCGTAALGTAAGALVPESARAQVAPPANVRVLSRPVLSPADFTYLGLCRLPADPAGTRFGFSRGALTGRRVGGELRLFVTGHVYLGDPVYEVTYPGCAGSLASAPVAPLVRAWGDIYDGRKRMYRATEAPEVRGLLWHGGRLWWTYGDPYNASSSSWDPSVGVSELRDDGSHVAGGPWRTTEHSQKTRGYLMTVPSAFASAYTGNRTVAVGAPITSGDIACSFGPAAVAFAAVATTTPPDPVQTSYVVAGDEPRSLLCTRLVLHDYEHRAARDSDYVECGWNAHYDCSQGSWKRPGLPRFHTMDRVSAGVWIDLPDKHGVLFMGQLIHHLPGWPVPHVWYGPQTCCHGQTDNYVWQATGPGTLSQAPFWWIYDPNDLARVARGETEPWAITPKHTVANVNEWGPVGPYWFGGAYFDAETRLLFATATNMDKVTSSYEPRPVVHVWRVS